MLGKQDGLTGKGFALILGGFIVAVMVIGGLIGRSIEPGPQAETTAETAAAEAATLVEPTPALATPQAVTPDKHFDYTAREYEKYFNAVLREMGDRSKIRARVTEGPVNDAFQAAINDHTQVVGVVGKAHGKVKSITVIGAGDGTQESGELILLGTLNALAAALPDANLKVVGQELSALITEGNKAADKKATRTFMGARLSYSHMGALGVWISAEPL